MGKRKEQETVIADEQIVELYFRREEGAIRETDKKYGKYHYFSIDIFGLTSKPTLDWILEFGIQPYQANEYVHESAILPQFLALTMRTAYGIL
jgi:hypothetical protein